MKRTVLYYPKVVIPDGVWLRHVLLYFDEVGSIFPSKLDHDWNDHGAIEPPPEHMTFLEQAKAYRRFAPELINRRPDDKEDWQATHDLADHLAALVRSDELKARLPPKDQRKYVRIHRGKLAHSVLDIFEKAGLSAEPFEEDNGNWQRIEATVAQLFLGMLATTMADIANERTMGSLRMASSYEPSHVVTGTDTLKKEDLIWRPPGAQSRDTVLSVSWRGVLPTPGPEVDLDRILAFKQTRRDELLRFRAEVDGLQSELKDTDAPLPVLNGWKTRMETEVATIGRLMNESGWQTIWGSLKALFEVEKLGPLGTLVVAGAVHGLPVEVSAAGVAVAGSMRVGSEIIDRRRRKREIRDSSPFTFVHSGRSEGIVD